MNGAEQRPMPLESLPCPRLPTPQETERKQRLKTRLQADLA